MLLGNVKDFYVFVRSFFRLFKNNAFGFLIGQKLRFIFAVVFVNRLSFLLQSFLNVFGSVIIKLLKLFSSVSQLKQAVDILFRPISCVGFSAVFLLDAFDQFQQFFVR